MSEAPITLYLDLAEGAVADLDVVARAALAWSATIKELVYVLDPSLEVRVEIASGTAGSFSLNSLIRAVKKAKDEPVTLGAVLIVLALYFGGKVVDHYTDDALRKLLGGDAEVVQLSPEQMNQLAERVTVGVEAKLAQAHATQVYRELERDPAIKGVGVTTTPSKRPEVVVPRTEFATRAGHGQIREETIHRRTVPAVQEVILIKPALVEAPRRWRLKTADGERGFVMKDEEFLKRVLSGTTPVPMVTGIVMKVETETTEEFKNGVWTPIDRVVTRVVGLSQPERQSDLDLSPHQEDEPDDDDDE